MHTVYCRYIRTNGERCCAFAMRGQSHCFFHSQLNTRHERFARREAAEAAAAETTILTPLKDHGIHGNGTPEPQLLDQQLLAPPEPEANLDLPPLEDRDSIQLALSMLVSALGANRIETRRASAILYGLQVASANAAHLRPPDPDKLVIDTVRHPATGQFLAPDVDPDCIKDADVQHFRSWLAANPPHA